MSGGIINRIVATVVAAILWAALVPAAGADAVTPVQTCVRHAMPGERAAAMFADPRGFRCDRAQRSFGAGDYWVRSGMLPRLEPGALVRSASVWQESATLYVRYADGSIRATGFDRTQAWQHLKLGAIFELALPTAAARPVQLLWHVRGSTNIRGIVLHPYIVTPAESQREEIAMAAFYAAFAGLSVALLAFNAALGAALRQRFHPPYCAMVLFLLAYAASSSGLLGQIFAMDNNLRLRLNVLLLAGVLSSAMVFARRFFAPRVTGGWMGPAIGTASMLLVAASVVYAIFMPWQAAILDRLVAWSFMGTLALALPLLWRGWRANDRYARGFAVAWAVPLLLASARIAQALGLFEWRFWIDNSTLIAMALEASFSALAIAWRIKALGEERDAAREQEMLARLLADSDPLTGLMNRRSFLREAIGRDDPHLLVLIDIDHFKQVNDTLGHDGGDQVLRTFAAALRAAVPDDALVARIGGEEFAVLAAGHALDLPDAILAQIRAAPMPFDLSVTASLGSERGTIGTEPEWKQLYRRADEALYAAKNAGRDRARWAVAA